MIETAENTPALDQLAAGAQLSPFHFHRVFKQLTGLTPKAYAAAHRAQKFREALPHCDTVTEAIYEAGFNSSGRFYEQAPALLGMTPGNYKMGGPGEIIPFAVGECSLGSILVAASGRGVCAIFMGDDPNALAVDLQDRFPKAELVGGESGFEQWVAQVVGWIERPGTALDLPLDIRGTAFQQQVWQALREIPPGTTLSYRALAEKIGSPLAVRAVAGACAANALAVAIPCHRVLRLDGSLSGYRWGVARKAELLTREKM